MNQTNQTERKGLLRGLSDMVFGKADESKSVASAPYFQTFTEYNPQFSSYQGSIYEQALTRAAVEKFAVSCMKLKPEVVGSAKPRIHRAIETAPSKHMTWSKFLARLATILEVDTTAYVVPVFDERLSIVGIHPLKAEYSEILEYRGEPWIRFHFATGETAALELRNVCILTKFQYESDYFGSGNDALLSTLKLMHAQEQAQEAAIDSGAKIRFIAQAPGQMRPEDIDSKRKLFAESNLSSSNTTGLMIYDTSFVSLKQIDEQHYTIDPKEMERIKDNVHTYFGVNDAILKNDFNEDVWGSYYEGKIEPFAIQLSEGLTNMLYTPREQQAGNRITFSSNRLAFASNASKRNMVRDMVDRGIMTLNEAREVLQLPSLEGGDVVVIRGEYKTADNYLNMTDPSDPVQFDKDRDPGGDDQEYHDNDMRGNKDEDWGV